jgi:hypothetical protein
VSTFPVLRPGGSWSLLTGRKPPLFEQQDGHFCWAGNNMHTERVEAGKELARYLEALAGIFPGELIDVVAHSHGCNVFKVATNHVSSRVPLGRAVFLAAPHCENVAGSASTYLYRLNSGRLLRDSGGTPPVLNVFSDEDTVQTHIAEVAPDFLTAPGTLWAPVFTAHRTDPDPATRPAYENLQLPTRLGSGRHVHGAMHGPAVGVVVGHWLARWPKLSGAECLQQCGSAS